MLADGLGGAYVAAVHGEGYCPNSETHNKQATPGACDQAPTSTPHVLNYNIGKLEDWRQQLVGGQLSSACSATMQHGAYDQGALPQVHLFQAAQPAAASSSLQTPAPGILPTWLGIAATHEAFTSSDTDVGNCGAPTARSGVIVDGWALAYEF